LRVLEGFANYNLWVKSSAPPGVINKVILIAMICGCFHAVMAGLSRCNTDQKIQNVYSLAFSEKFVNPCHRVIL
jgi:hypothetical protein